jgi:uncharacterized protein DUF5343
VPDSYPYISGAGNIVQAVTHFRKSFPATVTADTLKKLGIAPNGESYVINTLRFIGVLDSEGKKTSLATKAFSQHEDDKFSKEFGLLVQSAYKDLFQVHGEGAWTLDKDSLITFFRQSDDTSATIGGRQASVFLALAGLSGHGDAPVPKKTTSKTSQKSAGASKRVAKVKTEKPAAKPENDGSKKVTRDLGLTVRIEINLPADGAQETYDRIFKSLRENLIDG